MPAAPTAPAHDGLTGSFPLVARVFRAHIPTVSGGSSMRVQLAHVTKSYGAQVVLDDVSLTIGPHARIGLVGPNGVGKSTLLRIVAGAVTPDAGAVTRAPDSATVGYLEQERRFELG